MCVCVCVCVCVRIKEQKSLDFLKLILKDFVSNIKRKMNSGTQFLYKCPCILCQPLNLFILFLHGFCFY